MIKKLKNIKLSTSNFLIIPKPLPDEILSSWLVRIAYAHQTHPHTFINLYLNDENIHWPQSFDVSLTKSTLEKIATKSHKTTDDICKMSLQTYVGFLQENISSIGANSLIVPQRYCPVCFREDSIPYFRKNWRILFTTVCFKHKCFLYETCTQCNSHLDISRMYLNKLSCEYCHECGFQLKKARKLSITNSLSKAFKRTKAIQNILSDGYITLQNKPIYSFQFFEVLLQITKICIHFKKFKYLEYIKVIEELPKIKHSIHKPLFTQTSIKQQFFLFSEMKKLFENYPYNFTKYIKSNNLSHWKLTKDMASIPYWYDNLLDKVSPKPSSISSLLTLEEVASATEWLKKQNIEINKANMRKLLQCDFYHNLLGKRVFHAN